MKVSTLLSDWLSGATNEPESTTTSTEGASDATIVRECRSCGTTVAAGTTTCPSCSGTDIVSHSIE